MLDWRQFQVGESRGRIDVLCIPRASQDVIETSKTSMQYERLGSGIEALLDHKLGLSGVLFRANDDEVIP